MLKKKSSSIAYHFVCVGVAKNEWLVAYINTHEKVADILTKPLSGGVKWIKCVKMLLHQYNATKYSGE